MSAVVLWSDGCFVVGVVWRGVLTPPLRDMNAGAYMYRGKAKFGSNKMEAAEGQFVEFSNDGGAVSVEVGEGGAKFLLLAGQPLHEPIARHGPFVMSTREEIKQAFVDYSEGKLVRTSRE